MKNLLSMAKKLLFGMLCMSGMHSLVAAANEMATLSIVNQTGVDIKIKINFPSYMKEPSLISCHEDLYEPSTMAGQIDYVNIQTRGVVQYEVNEMSCFDKILVSTANESRSQNVKIKETRPLLEGCVGENMANRLLIITQDGDQFRASFE